ncbi:hypothetical protein AAD018_016490 [Aestuariibius insulae]|uniref:hypothetical protein n=1 Tax=Aestuariibius insulae TaxID=2058287 RepID=UPI00345E9AD5
MLASLRGVFTVAILGCGPVWAEGHGGSEDTLRALTDALVRAAPSEITVTPEPEDDRIQIRGPDTGPHFVFPTVLHNRLSLLTPQQREIEVADFAASVLADPSGSDLLTAFSPDQILPTLRPSQMIETITAGDDSPREFPVGPFLPGLSVFFMVNTPQAARFMTRADQNRVGLDDAALIERALENLASEAERVEIVNLRPPYRLVLDGAFENALLLHEPLWIELEMQYGPLLVLVSDRHDVVFSPAENRRSFARMVEYRDDLGRLGAIAISGDILLRQAGMWSYADPVN